MNGKRMGGHITPKVISRLGHHYFIKFLLNRLFWDPAGIWVTPPGFCNPIITLFGSTNLNSRSANLDTELSFLLHTRSPALRHRLHEEVRWLRKDSRTVGVKEWMEDSRRVPLGTRLLVDFVVGSML